MLTTLGSLFVDHYLTFLCDALQTTRMASNGANIGTSVVSSVIITYCVSASLKLCGRLLESTRIMCGPSCSETFLGTHLWHKGVAVVEV